MQAQPRLAGLSLLRLAWLILPRLVRLVKLLTFLDLHNFRGHGNTAITSVVNSPAFGRCQ